MILPPRKLKNYSHHIVDFTNGPYEAYDTVIITYFKKFLGFGYEKKEMHKFTRSLKGDNWVMKTSCAELDIQLTKLAKGKWKCVSAEVFAKIEKDHPEYLL